MNKRILIKIKNKICKFVKGNNVNNNDNNAKG